MNWQEIGSLIRIFLKFLGIPILITSAVLYAVLHGKTIMGSKFGVSHLLMLFIGSLIAVFVMIVLMVKMIQAIIRQKPRAPEQTAPSAKASAKSRTIKEMKEQLKQAIRYIKKKRLSVQGKPKLYRKLSAAYRLPFLLMIGSPNEWKALLARLEQINDSFYLADDKAVLIEPRNSENELINLLNYYREIEPLNGVLVAIDAQEVVAINEQEARDNQKISEIRKQITDLIKQLNYNFPVYILFTKCDKMTEGFAEFFAGLPKHEPLGAMVNGENSPEQAFEQERENIYSWLLDNELKLLSAAKTPAEKQAIALFPESFDKAFRKLKPFVEVVFQADQLDASISPIFRGFFFAITNQLWELIAADREISRWTKKGKNLLWFWRFIFSVLPVLIIVLIFVISFKLKGGN
jgi:type VI protein secretion system component VasK